MIANTTRRGQRACQSRQRSAQGKSGSEDTGHADAERLGSRCIFGRRAQNRTKTRACNGDPDDHTYDKRHGDDPKPVGREIQEAEIQTAG